MSQYTCLCLWKFTASGMWCCVIRWVIFDIWKDRVAFTFVVKHYESEGSTVPCNVGRCSHYDTALCPKRLCLCYNDQPVI